MLSLFSSGHDPASQGIADASGVTTGTGKSCSSSREEGGDKQRSGSRRSGRRGDGLSRANSGLELGIGEDMKEPVKRTNSGKTLERLTRTGGAAKLDDALKRTNSGTRLNLSSTGSRTKQNGSGNRLGPRSGSSRNLGAKSGSLRNIFGSWSKEDGDSESNSKSLSRNGSSRNLGRSGSSRNVLSRSGSPKSLVKSGSVRNLGVARTNSKKRSDGGSRSPNNSARNLGGSNNSGFNFDLASLTGDAGMMDHLDKMEAFVQIVSNSSQDERDKMLQDALVHKAGRS